MSMSADVLVEKKKLAKSPLEIHHLGDRALRQSAKRVAKIDAEIKQIIREMLQTMYSSDGIGLAAPQVAIQKQIIVVDVKPDEAATPPLVLINPTIVKTSCDLSITQEGCLSIPGVYLDVKRPAAVEVSYKDEYGRPQRLQANELLACCIQHEIDHLNGVLFVDRVENGLLLDQELKKYGFSANSVKSVRA
jgi:peptide deformylase